MAVYYSEIQMHRIIDREPHKIVPVADACGIELSYISNKYNNKRSKPLDKRGFFVYNYR